MSYYIAGTIKSISMDHGYAKGYAEEMASREEEQIEVMEIPVSPIPSICERCTYYEQELMALRGMEVVWRLKLKEELKKEREKMVAFQSAQHENTQRLTEEINKSKLACLEQCKIAEINAALVQQLQAELKVLRIENENLLVTIQYAFRNNSKTEMGSTGKDDDPPQPMNKQPKNVLPSCKKPNKVNNVLECNQINTDEESDVIIESDDDQVEHNPQTNGYLENINSNLEPEDTTEEKICLWTEPGQHPCHEIFNTMQEIKTHVKEDHIWTANNAKILCFWKKCSMKGHIFKQKQSLVEHMELHTSEQLFKCNSAGCGKSFSCKSQLKSHSRIHMLDRPYSCSSPACDQRFMRHEHVIKHEQHVHQMYHCRYPSCEGKFTCKDTLTRHEQRVHASARIFQCHFPMCGNRFTSYKELRTHRQLVHQSYQCKFAGCGKKFPNRKDLFKHRAVHKSQTPHSSTVPDCNRLLMNESKSNRHIAVHAANKLQPCPKCSKVFIARHHLEKHLRTMHAITQPFHCTFIGCGKTFISHSRLMQHVVIHNKSLPKSDEIHRPRKLVPEHTLSPDNSGLLSWVNIEPTPPQFARLK